MNIRRAVILVVLALLAVGCFDAEVRVDIDRDGAITQTSVSMYSHDSTVGSMMIAQVYELFLDVPEDHRNAYVTFTAQRTSPPYGATIVFDYIKAVRAGFRGDVHGPWNVIDSHGKDRDGVFVTYYQAADPVNADENLKLANIYLITRFHGGVEDVFVRSLYMMSMQGFRHTARRR